MGCSTVDKAECNNTMKGLGNSFECYCKADLCNGATVMAAGNAVTATLTAAVVIGMLGRSV